MASGPGLPLQDSATRGRNVFPVHGTTRQSAGRTDAARHRLGKHACHNPQRIPGLAPRLCEDLGLGTLSLIVLDAFAGESSNCKHYEPNMTKTF